MDTNPSTGPAARTPRIDAGEAARLLPQLNQRLLQLTAQLNEIHAEVDKLSASLDDDSAQIAALVTHLTDTQSTALLQRRLAEFTEEMSSEHDQLNFVALKLNELATKDQLVRMAAAVATQGQVAELHDIVQNLVRTQELANRLSESREEHVEALLGTLQGIVTHRRERLEQSPQRREEEIQAIRRAARGEFAADFLPALDGVEIALDRARTILARQRHELARLAQAPALTRGSDTEPPPSGLLDKLRSRVSTDDLNATQDHGSLSPTQSMAATVSATEAWLNHLILVRDRFISLLALEGIEQVPALNQKFDPRLHMAIDSEIRTDVPPNTVVRELRKGYRQAERVLRFAEVVIAQAPDAASPSAAPKPSRDRPRA